MLPPPVVDGDPLPSRVSEVHASTQFTGGKGGFFAVGTGVAHDLHEIGLGVELFFNRGDEVRLAIE